MVGGVAVLAAVCLLGLVLGVWRRRGLLGSLNRVVGAAVLVRLAFLVCEPAQHCDFAFVDARCFALIAFALVGGSQFASERTA